MDNKTFLKHLQDNGYIKIATAETVYLAEDICFHLKRSSGHDIFEHLSKDVYEKPIGGIDGKM